VSFSSPPPISVSIIWLPTESLGFSIIARMMWVNIKIASF
jgi:hypothetical protein